MAENHENFRQIFNTNIALFLNGLRIILQHYPASIKALLKVIRHQKKANRLRNNNLANGIPVPPLLIVSTTDVCNLHCEGCYAHALKHKESRYLPEERIHAVVAEAEQLGVSAFLLAGGEPLMQKTWLDALSLHPSLAGLVFTNGTLLHGKWLDWFDHHRQILPLISLEGNDQTTDRRRGPGVFKIIRESIWQLQDQHIPYGLSITVNRQNLAEIQSESMVAEYIGRGCRMFVYVEYVPAQPGTENLTLTLPEKQDFIRWLETIQHKYKAMFMQFPGDEEPYGGCLASARGFVHISTSGDLEPCPFAPYADRNLSQYSLAEALQSELLSAIRSQHHRLEEGRGGCALWHHREWVAGLLKQTDSEKLADPTLQSDEPKSNIP